MPTNEVSVAEAVELGAVFSITDALTGVSTFRLNGRMVATHTPLCYGCDRVLA
jgi:hypothetical protein